MKLQLRGDSIRDVMTPEPVTVATTTSLEQAARHMRDAGIGNVIVLDGEQITGILTDRDIVVRAGAEGWDPSQTPVGDVASRELRPSAPTRPSTPRWLTCVSAPSGVCRWWRAGGPSASCPWATSPSSATPTLAWGRSARRRPTTERRAEGERRGVGRAPSLRARPARQSRTPPGWARRPPRARDSRRGCRSRRGLAGRPTVSSVRAIPQRDPGSPFWCTLSRARAHTPARSPI
jgi:hypothetical protein